MQFYDFNKIWLLSGGRSNIIVNYFKHLVDGKPRYQHLKGDNFMLNPLIVTENPLGLDKRTLAEYIGLCSLRNYINYSQHLDVDLDIEYFPDYIPKEVVESNPLIAINQTKIKFKQEVKICHKH